MNRILSLLRRAQRDERGMVLANVIIFGTVLMLMVATMVAISTSGAIKSTTDRNYQNAMAAAYAGLADYQSKISNDNSYSVYGNVAAAFSKASGSTFSGGMNGNVAFKNSGSASSDWASVPGASDESFRYEVDNSNYSAKGILRVRVTGKSGTSIRSLVADLRGDGFINYLYFTNYESSSPALTGSSCKSYYQWQTGVSNRCDPVQFGDGDTLNGPVRTNDTFTSCGGTFNSTVEDHGGYVNTSPSSTCKTSKFNGGAASAVPSLTLPALNANMSQEARTDLTSTVPRPGCLYTGPTKVIFNGDGTMTVWSPWTRATQYRVDATSKAITAEPNTSASAQLCGSISALQSQAGATISTLPTNLMYVQDVPQSNDPKNVNYWGDSTPPVPSGYSNTYCTTAVTVSSKGKVTTSSGADYSNGVGFPVNNEWINNGSYTQGDASSLYSCTAGDVFVSGKFSGSMTIASSGTVWVTDNITYKDPLNDILGLVGQNAVQVWNPAKCQTYYAGYNNAYCKTIGLLNRSGGENLSISAAIAANAGTFTVQNYNVGNPLGTLTVTGSIAQNWRGPVATSSSGRIVTGFTKNYVYDNRLLTTAPPKFLQPVSTTYGVTTQVEVQAAYKIDGSCATTSSGACR